MERADAGSSDAAGGAKGLAGAEGDDGGCLGDEPMIAWRVVERGQ